LRGGSWNNNTDNLRCDERNNNNPDNRNNNNGFRVVRPNHALCSCAGAHDDAVILRNCGQDVGMTSGFSSCGMTCFS
jgi:hypothetical protein